MQPQQPPNGPPQGYPPAPGTPPQPGPLPQTPPGAAPGPNTYTTQTPQGSPYATPLDAQPGMPVQNTTQYDFIVADGRPAVKGLFGRKPQFPGAASSSEAFKKRLIIGVAGFMVIAAVIVLVAGFFLSSNSGSAQDLVNVAADQTEIIRVASIGIKQARSTPAQVLASTTSFSVQTDLNASLAALKKHRIKGAGKLLGASKNAKADALLAVATQNNRFDDEFVQLMNTMLVNYQKKVKLAYDASQNALDKQVLANSYKHVTEIIGPQATAAPPAVSPTPTPASGP